ncbi:MAG TPA: hypothetical protein DEB63_06785 [Agrobacterium sp.]|uniref:hypothetical protein n=1 Tax=Rhizobium sp. TaxID=391 RepID=UPI000E7F40AF|nr:hypothetical protein [Agrobacterium sp.]
MIDTATADAHEETLKRNAYLGACALFSAIDDLESGPAGRRKHQLCLLFSEHSIGVLEIGARQPNRSDLLDEALFEFKLPKPVQTGHLRDYIGGDGVRRIMQIHVYVSILQRLVASGHATNSEHVVSTMKMLQDEASAVCDDFDRITSH